MCILCVVQRWSRWVSTMLPWLVIPLIFFWALSQFFPPGFQFEITSPRLGCVLVLLVTLFWYEILMPQLSVWRARRSARLRERQRTEALELQKLRKTATRRCRNCLTPYRDQNPGGGRFMCSYCGHISKRPVLDVPGTVVGSSGIISDLLGKNGWICSQDWSVEGHGSWVSPVPRYWVGGGGDGQCLTEKSYSGVVAFACKLLLCFFSSVSWLCRKVFRFGCSREESSSDSDYKGSSSKRGENGGNLQESRWEKARRKAEEKRQARLEREMLEEEERKQREEVARLVEERRKLRDEKLEAERERAKSSALDGEREKRKDAEKKRHERRREKDRGSSKSNSDVEDLEKRASRESERKRELDRKSENEKREALKSAAEIYKSQSSEPGHGNKVTTNKPRYFGRMTGSFLSSSGGFSGASFFGRHAQSPAAPGNKASKPAVGFVDHGSGIKRDGHSAGHVTVKSAASVDGTSLINIHRPVSSDVQPHITAPKKSWHQLFTRSAAVSPYPDTNTSSPPSQNSQLEAQSAQLPDQRIFSNYSVDNQINYGQSLPLSTYPPVCASFCGSTVPHLVAESLFSPIKESAPHAVQEEAELFEDPCYVPDPVSLLGPVSKSLDSLPVDLGTGFVSNDKMEVPRVLKNVSAPGDVNKPSPIESPMSRLRVFEEKHTASSKVSGTPNSQESHSSNLDESSNAQGTWQMWGTPLAQDALGLVGGPSSWFSPLGTNKFKQENIMHPLSHNAVISQISNEEHVVPEIQSPQHVCVINQQNGGIYSPLGPGLNGNDMWMQKSPFQPLPVEGESHFLPLNLIDNIARNDVKYDGPNESTATYPFELPPANCWSKREWATNGPQEAGNLTPATPHIGGLFSTNPDVQSVWSFNQKETV
ncbi:stress response protein nst1-like [Phoenix dactylifera]|uniref:Stress response protein nst1-like n=1 Tax=Phoenix dactylifera TaxID=42345 RepID=A0A8B7C5G0_PHODC|nr:stress response protein nst1-like [Phoenix dactylifera]XP_008792200.2 stress response protein nst1-like [Phoenix dactylifera]